MPFSPEDLDQLTQLISVTVNATLSAQRQGGTTTGNKAESVDERFFRKISVFKGENFKDFSFQFKSAARGSSEIAYNLLNWAEREETEIEDSVGFPSFEHDDDESRRISGEIFNVIITMMQGEALQLLHNCNFSGAEAWRRLTRRYSPSTPLRAMNLMLQVINPGQARTPKEIQSKIDRWESQVLAMERDFQEKISSKMKAAIIISMLPNDLQDALIQQADRYEDYRVAKEKIISIVEAKLAMRSPDEMDVDTIGSGQYHTEWESLDAVGKGGYTAIAVEDKDTSLQSAEHLILAKVKARADLDSRPTLPKAKVKARVDLSYKPTL